MSTNPNPALKKNILAGLSVPAGLGPELSRFLRAVKQHLQLSHGTKGQPKERFVTIDELRLAGLIEVAIKGERAEIKNLAGVADTAVSGSSSPASPSSSGLATKFASLSQGHALRFSTSTLRWENVQLFDSSDIARRASLPSAIAYLDVGAVAFQGTVSWGSGRIVSSSDEIYPAQLIHAGVF
jgi:hypothetical protein